MKKKRKKKKNNKLRLYTVQYFFSLLDARAAELYTQ
jgi:hypothetical protein